MDINVKQCLEIEEESLIINNYLIIIESLYWTKTIIIVKVLKIIFHPPPGVLNTPYFTHNLDLKKVK